MAQHSSKSDWLEVEPLSLIEQNYGGVVGDNVKNWVGPGWEGQEETG